MTNRSDVGIVLINQFVSVMSKTHHIQQLISRTHITGCQHDSSSHPRLQQGNSHHSRDSFERRSLRCFAGQYHAAREHGFGSTGLDIYIMFPLFLEL